jgi:hypothetical protein
MTSGNLSDVVLTGLLPCGQSEQEIQSEREIRFSSRGSHLVFSTIGVLFLLWMSMRVPLSGAAVLVTMAMVLAASALRGILSRERLTLDLVRGRYFYRRGSSRNVAAEEGPLNELKAVVLDVFVPKARLLAGRYQRMGPSWIVSLAFDDPGRKLAVGRFGSERSAYIYAQRLAGPLRLPTVDRTRGDEQRTERSEIEKPLAAERRPDGTVAPVPPLPADSAIRCAGEAPWRKIALPVYTRSVSAIFAIIAFCLLIVLVEHFMRGGRFGAGVGLLAIFGLLPTVIAAIATSIATDIQEAGDSLLFSRRMPGITVWRKRLRKTDIVAVEVRLVPTSLQAVLPVIPRELQIRTFGDLLNLKLSPRLPIADMQWLAQALQAMAAGA